MKYLGHISEGDDLVTKDYADSNTPPSRQVLIENSITLGLEHANKQLVVSSLGDITITIPLDVFQDYTEIEVVNVGDGTITFQGEAEEGVKDGRVVNFITTVLTATPVLREYGMSACLKLMSVLDNNLWLLQGAVEE